MDAALRKNEERLRLALAAADMGAWRWKIREDEDTRDAGFNRILGLEARETTQPLSDFIGRVHPEDRSEISKSIELCLAGRGIYEVEHRIIRPDGSARWVRDQGRLFRDAVGLPDYMTGVVVDVTARKEAELELAEAQRQLGEHARMLEAHVAERTAKLQQTVQALEGFCYSIAHDLRAPLRAMQSFSNLLLEDSGPRLERSTREYAERIVVAASRMDQLIQDLLAYGRLAHEPLPMAPIELERILDGVLSNFREEIEARKAEVKTLGNCPVVRANATVLEQALSNLISNALKFATPGLPPKVAVKGEVSDGWARISVIDEGIGFDMEHRERIFRVFERLHSTEEYPGTGIGLAIVQKGIERMGGRLGVVSAPGQGSEFWFELPLENRIA